MTIPMSSAGLMIRLFLYVYMPFFALGMTVGLLCIWGDNVYRLARHQATARGIVVKITKVPTPTERRELIYSYRVGNQSYLGSGGHPDFSRLELGTPVEVHYLPEDPRTSTCTDPVKNFYVCLENAVTIPAVLAGIIYVAVCSALAHPGVIIPRFLLPPTARIPSR